MWLELGKSRPGEHLIPGATPRLNQWLNMDNVMRIEFEAPDKAKVISIKSGGSDTSIFSGDDTARLKAFVAREHMSQPMITWEYEVLEKKKQEEALVAAKKQEEEKAAQLKAEEAERYAAFLKAEEERLAIKSVKKK